MSYNYGYTAPPPPPPPPPYLVPAHPATALPTHQQLVQAAREFSQWLQSVAPGATAFICGGLALAMHGNARATSDADLAIDLSRTSRGPGQIGRPIDTNRLKDLAAQDPHHRFSVGPKIYWLLHTMDGQTVPVQVDFVDANLFWDPFEAPSMLCTIPHYPAVVALNLPTLLVSKMRSATERSQPNPIERRQKQVNDITDFAFALDRCLTYRIPVGIVQLQQLNRDISIAKAIARDFWALAMALEVQGGPSASPLKEGWRKLLQASRVPQEMLNDA